MALLTLYEIKRDLLPLGKDHNRPGTPLNAHGMVIHDTDDAGATDENEDSYFRTGYRASSAHTFIDWDSITEIIPDNEIAWHAGPTANSMYLGLELCVPASHDPAKFLEVWKRGVWYAALKFFKGGWATGPDLWSHAGVSARFKETDHQDPIAYFAEYGKSFSAFVSDVDAMIIAMKTESKGGVDVLDIAILKFSSEDDWSAKDVDVKLGGVANFTRQGTAKVIPKDAMSAKKLVVIGGATTGHPNEVLLSGQSKYDTAVAVGKYLG